jgi:hypothetical protein
MYSNWRGTTPRKTMERAGNMGKHDPIRDGDVHPDTAKRLEPKEFDKSGHIPTDDDDDNDENDD